MAATVRYWKAGSTDINQAASWHDGTGGSSAVPLVSNIVYWTEGSDTVTSGLTALSGVDLQYFAINQGASPRIGGNGSSLLLSVNTNGAGQYADHLFVYAASGGYAYVKAADGGIGVVRVEGAGHLYLTGGTINTGIQVIKGELDVSDSVDLSNKSVEIWGGNTVIAHKADATDPTITVWGGTLLLRRTSGTLTVNGGHVILQVEKETNAAATLTINGGMVDWRAGSIGTALNLNGGKLTFKNAMRPINLASAMVTAADTEIDGLTAPGAKVTWPDVANIAYRAGKAAVAFARSAGADVA